MEEAIRNGLADGPGIDYRELLDRSPEELRALIRDRQLSPRHVELLAELFAEWCEYEVRPKNKLRLARRALLLYDLSGELSGTFCFHRAEREEELRGTIKKLDSD